MTHSVPLLSINYYPARVISQPPYLNFFPKMRFSFSKRCTQATPRGRGMGGISFDTYRSGLLGGAGVLVHEHIDQRLLLAQILLNRRQIACLVAALPGLPYRDTLRY